MVLGGEKGLECEVCLDGIKWDESDTDEAECSRKVVSGRRVAVAFRSLVNAWSLQLECASACSYIWMENERSRIRAVQMDNLRGRLGIKRMDKVPNAQMRQLCEVMKGVDIIWL